ncbi:hypothetical protein [Rhodococcus sp. SJ-3]|uniref:hypothetical protein n=1 Tax=Rhodococcus sp. SJ-3 TaxID=3454628 RepID=UPI003F79F54C
MSPKRKSLPEQIVTTDDDGIPNGVLDFDTVNRAATRLAFELAAVCDDEPAMDRVTRQYVDLLGGVTYRYAAALALKGLVVMVLRDAVEVVEHVAPELQLRQHLRDGAVRARENFPLG